MNYLPNDSGQQHVLDLRNDSSSSIIMIENEVVGK